MKPPTDFLGREIKAGDVLCYPVRRGSQMWLKRITVTQARADGVTGTSPEGRLVHIKNLNNTVIA